MVATNNATENTPPDQFKSDPLVFSLDLPPRHCRLFHLRIISPFDDDFR